MKYPCNDCIKLRTPACCNPEDCVQHGYKHFAAERRDLSKPRISKRRNRTNGKWNVSSDSQ